MKREENNKFTDPISINEISIKQTDIIEQTTKYLPNVPCPLHESQTKQPLVCNFYHGIILIVLYLKKPNTLRSNVTQCAKPSRW